MEFVIVISTEIDWEEREYGSHTHTHTNTQTTPTTASSAPSRRECSTEGIYIRVDQVLHSVFLSTQTIPGYRGRGYS